MRRLPPASSNMAACLRPRYGMFQSHSSLSRRSPCRPVAAASADSKIATGQVLRGHGPHGWKDAGWDLDARTVTTDLRDLILAYGEMAQATYDNLGMNSCSPDYGHPVAGRDNASFLDYLDQDYPLAPGKPIGRIGTRDLYQIPTGDTPGVSPFIYAVPGMPADRGQQPKSPVGLSPFDNPVFNSIFTSISSILVTQVDGGNGGRSLFRESNPDGRGKKARGAFMSYVAVSKPDQEGKVDVALVWRGTIFREEWQSNFAQDDLTVHEWLKHLMDKYDVGTITTTGHSLGGGLATLCAFDVAEWLQGVWSSESKPQFAKTKTKPEVTCISFAAPRVGNTPFVNRCNELGVKTLRVVTKGDAVPLVPGLFVQLATVVLDNLPVIGARAAIDTDFWPVALLRLVYSAVCAASYIFSAGNIRSRWGYFHVGQALELNVEWAGTTVRNKPGYGPKHNLELYLYLTSQLSSTTQGDRTTGRNELLMNKSDDLLRDVSLPANWWRDPNHRGYQLKGGRWHRPTKAP